MDCNPNSVNRQIEVKENIVIIEKLANKRTS